MTILHNIIDFLLHLNVHLAQLVADVGHWTYAILFAIIFAETGLVITPFLPGDSLLFAAGSLTAISVLNVHVLFVSLFLAAVGGNTTNYFIGRWFGHKLFSRPDSKLFNPKNLAKAHQFYERYGAYAVFISRFLPIIRTFVPFVAGMAEMNRWHYSFYNILGAFVWVALFVYGGFFFGQLPFVKQHFSWVVIAIIVISLLPIIFEIIHQRLRREKYD